MQRKSIKLHLSSKDFYYEKHNLCNINLRNIFTSCSESDSEVLSNVNLYLEENFAKNLDSVKFIVVIPEQGCGTCITQAENFYNEFSQNDDIVFVFCNIISNKILKHKVNINYDNTVFDYDNEFLSLLPQNKQIYPCVFVMKNGKASALIWQSVRQAAFMEIRKSINH